MNNQINQEFSKSTMADFEIISELGKGSFGYVYKVRRRTDSKIYALKKVAFSKLNPKEKQILLMRYYIGKTQMEVSEEIGISQAQVSRLEKNAIKSMKRNLN